MKLNLSTEIPPRPYGDGSPVAVVGSSRPNYPEVRFEGPEELNLPDTGKITLEYKLTREVSEDNSAGHWYICNLEIRKIVDVTATDKPAAPSNRDTSTEDALDKLAKDKQAEEADETDSEGY